MKESQNNSQMTTLQQWGLIILRIIIGWHFLYEGIIKLMDTGWSAESYLLNARGFLSGIFQAMASNASVMEAVDFLNIWGLIFIGLGLFLGIFARLAVYAGIMLLSFYYLAYPPFMGYNFGIPQEGHYLIVDKTFIEMIALVVLALFPAALNTGLLDLIKKLSIKISIPSFTKKTQPQPATVSSGASQNRRDLLKHLTFLPFLGSFAWACASQKKYTGVDGMTGSTIKLETKSLSEIEGKMPMGFLAKDKKPVSRLIMGSNLFHGNAHARDLIYVNSLFRAYNTEKKIIETYLLAEKAGITLVGMSPLFIQYRKIYSSNFQTWTNVSPTRANIYGQVDRAIDQGVDYIFIQGAACDRRVYEGEVEVIGKCVDYIKQQGIPAGLGAHTIQAMLACEEAGIDPDFYYKTLHHDNYWSAHPRENRFPFLWSSNTSPDHNKFHDNLWCPYPDETIEFIHRVRKPVVGFKVLAGGAIHPKEGFQFAFNNGADFIHVGMFDFQIIDDVIYTIQCFEKAKNRSRPWHG